MPGMVTGLLFGLCGMVCNSIAGFIQSDAARKDGPRLSLVLQPRYLGGLGMDGLGWVCTVVALRFLPVFAVQAILGASIALTAVIARFRYGSALRGVDRVAVVACLVGLVLVAGSAGDDRAATVSTGALVVLGVAAAGLAATLIGARHSTNASLLAVVAGLSFGGTSLAVRAVHRGGGLAGVRDLVTQPAAYLVIVFWVVGLASYTWALSLGSLARVTAVFLAVEVIVPGLVGILLLGDSVRAGWVFPMAAGLVLAASAVVVLSQSLTQRPPRTSEGAAAA
jgi:drug/metabolite transporter (DMT)-like permease